MNCIKVLTVTNMWPIDEYPYFGIFVKEQVEGLNKFYPEIDNKIMFIQGYKNRINYLKSIFEINWHIFQNQYDVIHIHYGLSGLFVLFNPFIKTPIITMIHGSDINSNRYIRLISKLVASRSNHIFYLNDKMKNHIRHLENKIEYLPCGVNTDLFNVDRGNTNKNLTIAFPASRIRPEKNFNFFEKVINSYEKKHNVAIDVVEIHGKSRQEVKYILNKVDILMMTSLYEGSPQIIKEAMCCNTPIISSNVGDVELLLKDVNNCIVIDQFDEDCYCEAIYKIANQSDDDRISNGRSKIFSLGLDEKSTSKKIVDAYKRLINV